MKQQGLLCLFCFFYARVLIPADAGAEEGGKKHV